MLSRPCAAASQLLGSSSAPRSIDHKPGRASACFPRTCTPCDSCATVLLMLLSLVLAILLCWAKLSIHGAAQQQHLSSDRGSRQPRCSPEPARWADALVPWLLTIAAHAGCMLDAEPLPSLSCRAVSLRVSWCSSAAGAANRCVLATQPHLLHPNP